MISPREGLPPEAPGRSIVHGKMLERQSRPDNPVSPFLSGEGVAGVGAAVPGA